ncbi:Pkinase-domain-containing protein [Lichtheimia hyalospora FSU 10163]|nr:Pkinase-domain-containing protein [Lichtheimia hyalospora FSU 10163]
MTLNNADSHKDLVTTKQDSSHSSHDSSSTIQNSNAATLLNDDSDLQRKRSIATEEHEKPSKERRVIPPTTNISSSSTTPSPSAVSNTNTARPKALDPPEPPVWEDHPNAWGYLQSLVDTCRSGYLDRHTYDDKGRTGYMLGRADNCDFICKTRPEISKNHCCIYMESGNNGRQKGINVYLEDMSSNGTFVNGQRVVSDDRRRILRSGDYVQLYRKERMPSEDPRHLFYRIFLPPQFEVGTFHEDYKTDDIIGRGHFASVIKAEHKKSGRVVAVKLIKKKKFERRPKMLLSTIQEMGVLMALEAHPCVIQIEKVYNEPKYIYLVLEFVRDGELFEHVVQNKCLSERDTRFLFYQLFSAIKFLHSKNIIHRDLKPENVLLVDKEKLHVKVTDFGLAKIKPTDEKLQSQCGTPNYVAPEVLNPTSIRSYDKECDMWSLGVMLYICLCGFPPFNEEFEPPSMKDQIRLGLYDFPPQYWDDISEDAKDLIKGLLTVDPTKRLTAEDALKHKWMSQDDDALFEMCAAISPNFKTQLDTVGTSDDSLPTQPINSLTQFTEFSMEL